MRTIICTTGISIAQGIELDRSEGNEADRGNQNKIRERIRKLRSETANDKEFLRQVCAETNSLQALGLQPDDDIHLLHTETPDGRSCAEGIKALLDDNFEVRPQLHQIEGLQVSNRGRFKQKGIQNLFHKIERISSDAREQGKIILNITGGFKSVVPYMTLYGLIYQMTIVYIFEFSNELIELPPAPVSFDYERLGQAMESLVKLEQVKDDMHKEDFFKLIPGLSHDERMWYETTLLEDIGNGIVWPSAFALILLEDYKREKAGAVLLSKSAAKEFNDSDGYKRKYYILMLANLSKRGYRQNTIHKFFTTDLSVCKPRNLKGRAAYFMRGEKVYVCELYGDHDRYDSDLPGRKKIDYSDKEFSTWEQPVDEQSPETSYELVTELEEELDEKNKEIDLLKKKLKNLEPSVSRNLEKEKGCLKETN